MVLVLIVYAVPVLCTQIPIDAVDTKVDVIEISLASVSPIVLELME